MQSRREEKKTSDPFSFFVKNTERQVAKVVVQDFFDVGNLNVDMTFLLFVDVYQILAAPVWQVPPVFFSL